MTKITSDLLGEQNHSDKLYTVADLYLHLDNLFDQDIDADTLFASGYLRGFISLVATGFGDEKQEFTTILIEAITSKLKEAKTELSPQDSVIVNNFWLKLQSLCQTESF
jgi:hypothetical protein